MAKIAYTQIDGWGVVGQIYNVIEAEPGAFLGLDDISDLASGHALVLSIEPKPFDQLSIFQSRNLQYWEDQVGSNFYVNVEDEGEDRVEGRFTLRAFTVEEVSGVDTVTRLYLFYPEGGAPNIVNGDLSPVGEVTLEDFYRMSTQQPELDFYTPNPLGAKVFSGSESVPLLPMGKDTLSRWAPILTEFTETVGQEVPLSGGIASSDGISISFVRDRDWEDLYAIFLRTFITSTATTPALQDDRPLVYRDSSLLANAPEFWVFTNEVTDDLVNLDNLEDVANIIRRGKRIYDPSRYVDSANNSVPFTRLLRSFQFNGINTGLIFEDLFLFRNPVAYYDNKIYTSYPLFLEANPRDAGSTYVLRTRPLWVNSELMQVTDVRFANTASEVNQVFVRRGVLNTTIKTHATQSEWYNEAPFAVAQRVRLFETDSSLSYVKDREGFEYSGLIVDGSSDNNTATFNYQVSTDLFSVYASINSGAGTEQATTVNGSVSSQRSSVRSLSELNEPLTNSYTGTASLYDPDEVYIRLCQVPDPGNLENTGRPLTGTVLNLSADPEQVQFELYKRARFFWQWVEWDSHFYRVSNDYVNYPVFTAAFRGNARPPGPFFHFPPMAIDVVGVPTNERAVVILHTPIMFTAFNYKYYNLNPSLINSDIWFINSEVAKGLRSISFLHYGQSNFVVSKEYPESASSLKNIFGVLAHSFSPNENGDQIVYTAEPNRVDFINSFDLSKRNGLLPQTLDISVIPVYKEKSTSLGHVFEASSPEWLAYELGKESVVGNLFDNFCQVNLIDIILQLLTSTGTGENAFNGYAGLGIFPGGNGPLPPNPNFDILPVGLGLGIPTEFIDLDSFMKYVVTAEERERRRMFVRNFSIKLEDAKDKKKIIEDILKALYLSIVTDEKGVIRMVDTLSETLGRVITVNDLANRDDQGTYSHDISTKDIVEAVLTKVKRVHVKATPGGEEVPAPGTGSDFVPFAPRPAPTSIRSSSETRLENQAGEEISIYFGSERGNAKFGLVSDIFDPIQAKPREVEVSFDLAGRSYENFNPLTPRNQEWGVIASSYIERFSRPVPAFKFSIRRSFDVQLGELVEVNLPNFPGLLGREDSVVVGVVTGQVIDVFNDIKELTVVILRENFRSLNRPDKVWTPAGQVKTTAIGSGTIVIEENAYLVFPGTNAGVVERGVPTSNPDLTNSLFKDVDGFLPGDVISIFSKWFEFKDSTTLVSKDRNADTLTVDPAVSVAEGDILMVGSINTQPVNTPEAAGNLISFLNNLSRWR